MVFRARSMHARTTGVPATVVGYSTVSSSMAHVRLSSGWVFRNEDQVMSGDLAGTPPATPLRRVLMLRVGFPRFEVKDMTSMAIERKTRPLVEFVYSGVALAAWESATPATTTAAVIAAIKEMT